MRIFKNRWFSKFARKEGISDKRLIKVVQDLEAGIIDADLGGGVIKMRMARSKQGKSGGYRTIILYRKENRAFFVYGFAKNELENIDRSDVLGFKKLAKIILSLPTSDVEVLLEKGEIEEVKS